LNAYERLLLQENGRMRIPERESARGSPRRTQAPRTKFNGSGIGKKGGEVIRQPAQTRRTTTRSKAKAAPEICQPGCMSRDVSLASFKSEIAGATRLQPEARGDLHGRNHAHALRRLDDDLTLEQPQFRRAGPARRLSP
jgi:hypothetical protein